MKALISGIFSFALITLFIGSLAQEKLDFAPIIPEQKRFSSSKLDSLGRFLKEAGSASLIILKDGKVVYRWGDIDKKILVHSIRKALMNSLFGIYISNGIIDTTMTLSELNIDDIEPSLTDVEKSATVADLLKSRSGIYHNAAAVTEGMLQQMPERGTYEPNEHYFYNNWDFNALAHILEKVTGKSIYHLFNEHIAKPLGFNYQGNYTTITNPAQGWKIPDVDGFYQFETDKSRFPATHFRLSAKDLALYGQLFLKKGSWNGVQIVPEEWIDVSTKPFSMINREFGIGYGMLWNVLIPIEGRKSKSYFHTGLGVHMLAIYPASNMVLIHRVNTEEDYKFNDNDFYKMISLVWSAQLE